MAIKTADALEEDDHIVWGVPGDVAAKFTVTAVLVFPPQWPTQEEVAIYAADQSGEPRILSAKYKQEIEVPAW